MLTNIAHWLAVEGVQPSIPQNPTTAEARASELVPKGPGANPNLAALAGNDNVSHKPLVKHVISKELMLFFDKIRGAILDEDLDPEVVILRESAFESVRGDPGLHQLVPYFVQFVAEKVTHNLTNIFVLRQMMELTAAVMANKSFFIDPYVASLVPPVLTCLIARLQVPDGGENLKDQYDLRDLASSLLGMTTTRYHDSTQSLQARLVRTCLKKFLDPDASPGEHYGAINGLSSIGGPNGISVLVLPNIKPFEILLRKHQSQRGPNDEEVIMVIATIIKVIQTITKGSTVLVNGMNGNADDSAALEEFLGEMIGSRIARLGNRELNAAILRPREKTL